MQKLFIIGNGFDCYGHKMKTQYSDFKNYLIQKFPDYEEDYDDILEPYPLADGGEEYDMNAVVGAIVRILNECAGDDWKTLEACLGELFIKSIGYDNEWLLNEVDMEEEDKEIFHSVYNNEDISRNLCGAFRKLKELFRDWVFNELGTIDYTSIKKIWKKPSFKNSLFLNFNYTKTLEKVYKIEKSKICHIHGDAENKKLDIYFGHGDSEDIEFDLRYMGIENAFGKLKRELKKDTKKAFEDHEDFFERIHSVNKIYSYGFSFSEVDMVYIEEICKRIDVSKVRWYFNHYDWKNKTEYVDKIKALGFKVRRDYRW
ncbi:MAG: bacteriophage abortive infection AbiH family protein [Agathobacter sp.]|nr:bacteriophage abortive infection AbiH family protein [Agathobacter sp.]